MTAGTKWHRAIGRHRFRLLTTVTGRWRCLMSTVTDGATLQWTRVIIKM